MVVAIDTNFAIDFIRGIEKVKDIFLKYEQIYLPVTVLGELIFGALNSNRKELNLRKTKDYIADFKILEINSVVAGKYAEIRLDLKKKGKPIPENDIWIAATCSAYNIPLISNDKHFANIDEKFLILI